MSKLRPHPGRKRRFLGWVALAAALVLAGLWGASGWWWWGYTRQTWFALISDGRLVLDLGPRFTVPAPDGWHGSVTQYVRPPHVSWWADPFWDQRVTEDQVDRNLGFVAYHWWAKPGEIDIEIWLWPVAILLSAFGTPLLVSGVKAGRRARLGHCLRCNYDKRGLVPDALCPECGK